ncbi:MULTISPECIES: cysteine desulfurase family protein [unclassified Solwaraspora]|uniref:cysteine desulfurase family protein n=1 Tax=unclassified Solwaraspora TaxID=2627926 RepID=UPI00248B3F94|nr:MULTISPECIES: cysteine desulfurase family protein [unclassified Solwaraspora]WBB98384.1 cysteine desulfurase family protein [Solwaraspora sp. WMMA2059]WBC23063.1 cysteine desulfurase family protein [Solwaraspora sp. WMMA2080]WJK34903.1 cysteine desulfurase family protein [Solwaraspora sp. WMMA2065]
MAYLDHAATTPMLDEAVETYVATARRVGNASSLHAAGRAARRTVEEARERVAAALGARPSEVIFTAGGTESDNLAVKGIFWARSAADPARRRILASTVEHHAVLDAVQWLAEHGQAQVTWLPVDATGRVDDATVQAELDAAADELALVTVMWANNEVGTVQPVAAVAAMAARAGVPLHTDAVQAVGQVPVDFAASGAAALTVSGHKLGGPAGVGALLLGRDVTCTPLLHGGGQERDVRSGTVDTAGIAAFAVAVEVAVKRQAEHAARVGALRDDLVRRVRQVVPDVIYNGDPADRLPGNAHFSFPGCEGDALLLLLDAQGIACSTGSACSAGVAQPSHVLLAMADDDERARSSLRFSLGHDSTRAEVDALVAALPGAVERARRAGAVRGTKATPPAAG